jgi:hypothetical protein
MAGKSGLAKGYGGEIKDQFLGHAHPPQQGGMYSTTSLDSLASASPAMEYLGRFYDLGDGTASQEAEASVCAALRCNLIATYEMIQQERLEDTSGPSYCERKTRGY